MEPLVSGVLNHLCTCITKQYRSRQNGTPCASYISGPDW